MKTFITDSNGTKAAGSALRPVRHRHHISGTEKRSEMGVFFRMEEPGGRENTEGIQQVAEKAASVPPESGAELRHG